MRQPREMKNLSLENSPPKLRELLKDQLTKQPL
jgi:spore coat protein CotF